MELLLNSGHCSHKYWYLQDHWICLHLPRLLVEYSSFNDCSKVYVGMWFTVKQVELQCLTQIYIKYCRGGFRGWNSWDSPLTQMNHSFYIQENKLYFDRLLMIGDEDLYPASGKTEITSLWRDRHERGQRVGTKYSISSSSLPPCLSESPWQRSSYCICCIIGLHCYS